MTTLSYTTLWDTTSTLGCDDYAPLSFMPTIGAYALGTSNDVGSPVE